MTRFSLFCRRGLGRAIGARALVVGTAAVGLVLASVQAQDAAAKLAQDERAGCTRNLKTIFQAIRKYQVEKKDLPNWLSDLVPAYLPDPNVLVCPVCLRTGKTEVPPLADPKVASSYLFEFCPVPLGDEAPKARESTRREWKRRQMGLVGSMVPIVRCRHHTPVLNLAFDGRIYDSPGSWELALTNNINPDELRAARIFENEDGAGSYPLRETGTPPELIDLTGFYNARLSDSWHGAGGNDLAEVPVGVQALAGVRFDLRGIVQLRSRTMFPTNFPAEVRDIPVRRKCQRLHFLHAAAFGKPEHEGKQIGTYTVRYANNNMRVEIPVIYGQDLRDWHALETNAAPASLKEAWRGQNEVSRRAKNHVRLFLTTWTNPVPAFQIDALDLKGGDGSTAPFVVGITVE